MNKCYVVRDGNIVCGPISRTAAMQKVRNLQDVEIARGHWLVSNFELLTEKDVPEDGCVSYPSMCWHIFHDGKITGQVCRKDRVSAMLEDGQESTVVFGSIETVPYKRRKRTV